MTSLGDRLGWVEADVRGLIVRLDAAEQSFRSAEWQAKSRAEAATRGADEALEQSHGAQTTADGARRDVRALQVETTEAVRILSDRIDVHTIALWALTLFSLGEAVLIWRLWIRM